MWRPALKRAWAKDSGRGSQVLGGRELCAAAERENKDCKFFQSSFLRVAIGMDGRGAPRQAASLTNQGVRVSRRLLSPETEYDRSVRNRRRDEALGERGRRVFEDAGAKEGRCDPDGCERRNFLEDNCGLRRAEERRRISLLVIAGGDQGDGARFVIRQPGVGVETCVQLRRSRETQTRRERPQASYSQERH